jgi:isopenicillin-N epimerase
MRPFAPQVPWRLDPSITFLDHGVFGACPAPVLEHQSGLRERMESNPVAFLWRDHEAMIDGARRELAHFLHAGEDGLAFVPNATTGVSTVLRSLTFEPGDELLTTDHEYNATLNALAEVARRDRARVVVARIPLPLDDPEEVVAALVGAVTPRTRIALVSHVTSPTALVFPIERIVSELAARGVDTLVDAAHAPGMVAIDVDALGAAYWTGNGHKWLCGPKSSAVLHVRGDRRGRIRPLVVSHGWNDPLARPAIWKEFDWMGTVDTTPVLSLPEAIRVVGSLRPGGWPAVMAENRSLALEARRVLADALGSDPIAPETMTGSMAAARLPGDWTDARIDDLRHALIDEDRIEASIVGWPVRAARARASDPPTATFVRASTQLYNEPADLERLADALPRRLAPRRAAVAR